MAVQNLGNYNTLYGISRNPDDSTLSVKVGMVCYDNDVQCICDAIEYLATTGKGSKSITIESFNLAGITIKAGESPVDVYNRIRKQFGEAWYWDPMPEAIAVAQERYESRKEIGKNEETNSAQTDSEPGEKE